jgi:Short C-terminal domain
VPAAEAAWSIATEMLSDVAQAAIVMGIPVVIAAWLAGPARPAVAIRRALAPWLRTRPVLAYAALAVGILLVIWWEPIPATRMVLPVLLMIALSFAGLEVLRRQVAEEFPEVTAGEVGHSVRASWQRAVHAVSSARQGNGAAAAEPPAPPVPPVRFSRIDQLERLTALRDRGALTEEEFAAEKAQMEAAAGTS